MWANRKVEELARVEWPMCRIAVIEPFTTSSRTEPAKIINRRCAVKERAATTEARDRFPERSVWGSTCRDHALGGGEAVADSMDQGGFVDMAAFGSGREVQFQLQIALRSNERNCLTFPNKSQIPIPGTGIKTLENNGRSERCLG